MGRCGSDGGHNGLKHIDAVLGHNNYARLRFGIGHDYEIGTAALARFLRDRAQFP